MYDVTMTAQETAPTRPEVFRDMVMVKELLIVKE